MTTKPFTIDLPQSTSDPSRPVTIETLRSVVIVGANGSGKTRLGSWIDGAARYKTKTHRIAAHKSLQMPKMANATEFSSAQRLLLYGGFGNNERDKEGGRWGNEPNTRLINDFDHLMIYLFSQDYKQLSEARNHCPASKKTMVKPVTKLAQAKGIWENVLPHRQLLLHEGSVKVKIPDSTEDPYYGSEMSDGERVVFYLIGQVLAAPVDGIIIVDEPELHVHKTIQANLWDSLEKERSDCLFIYLTHDIDFAASRANAKKICLRDYSSKGWDWFEIPADQEIPEEIYLKVVGSRKPVLFVEGTKDSLDFFIYRHLYPHLTIEPRGSCEAVIHTTVSFKSSNHLHRLKAFGLVDRDFRSEQDIAKLREIDVSVLDIAEIENLLLTEPALRAIAMLNGHSEDGIQDLVRRVKDFVFEELARSKDSLSRRSAAQEIERSFQQFNNKAENEADSKAVAIFIASLDVEGIYERHAKQVASILTSRDYLKALQISDNKGLLAQAAAIFGFRSRQVLIEFVKRFLVNPEKSFLLDAIKKSLPVIAPPEKSKPSIRVKENILPETEGSEVNS